MLGLSLKHQFSNDNLLDSQTSPTNLSAGAEILTPCI